VSVEWFTDVEIEIDIDQYVRAGVVNEHVVCREIDSGTVEEQVCLSFLAPSDGTATPFDLWQPLYGDLPPVP
jgi:hypothetical protein